MEKKDELKKKLEKLFPSLYDRSSDEQPLNKEHLTDFIESLVSIGHLLILDQDLIPTMEVSIEEQLNGKQQKKLPQKSENPGPVPNEKPEDSIPVPKFNRIDFSFDSAITALVVKKFAEDSLHSMSLQEKEVFFNEHYKIGLETLDRHIPKSELKELILKGIVIFQDIFLTWQRKTKAQMDLNKSKSNRLDFWSRLALKLVGYMINFVIWVIKIILWRTF
jgi:hypothetical protein